MKSSLPSRSRRALLALGAAVACAVSLPALAERGGDGQGRRMDGDRGGRQERVVPIRRDDERDVRDDRRMRRLSPEERRQLKQDLRDAERDFYREEYRRRR